MEFSTFKYRVFRNTAFRSFFSALRRKWKWYRVERVEVVFDDIGVLVTAVGSDHVDWLVVEKSREKVANGVLGESVGDAPVRVVRVRFVLGSVDWATTRTD